MKRETHSLNDRIIKIDLSKYLCGFDGDYFIRLALRIFINYILLEIEGNGSTISKVEFFREFIKIATARIDNLEEDKEEQDKFCKLLTHLINDWNQQNS